MVEIHRRAGELGVVLRTSAYRLENLKREQQAVEEAYRAALRGTGLRLDELELLIAIVREWFPTVSRLAESLRRDRAGLRNAIDALAGRGFVAVERTPRRSILSLTDEGVSIASLGIACCRIIDAEHLARTEKAPP